MSVAAMSVLAGVVAVLLTIAQKLWPSKTIGPNELAIKFRWGRVVRKGGKAKVYHANNALVLPGVHKLQRCEAFEQVAVWPDHPVTLKDGHNIRVSITLRYRVVDPVKALIRADNLEEVLRVVCKEQLINYLSARTHSDIGDSTQIARRVEQLLHTAFEDRGVGNCIISFEAFSFEAESPGLLIAAARWEFITQFRQKHPEVSIQEALALLGLPVLLGGHSQSPGSTLIPLKPYATNGNGHLDNGNGLAAVAAS